ncbi:MAG: hypothetical protein ABJQ70_16310 [Roseobacter sp.]
MSDPIYLSENEGHAEDLSFDADIIAAKVASLSDDRCALFYDADALPGNIGARLTVSIGSIAQISPVMISRLPLIGGGQRSVILLQTNGDDLQKQKVKISRGPEIVAQIDPHTLQSPLVDQLSLLSGLSEEGQSRFLRVLLTTGPSLFKNDAQTGGSLNGFEKIITQLLASLSAGGMALHSFRSLGTDARLLIYFLPKGHDIPKINDLVQVTDDRVQRVSNFTVTTHPTAGGTAVHLVLSQSLKSNATLISISDNPLRLEGPGKHNELRPLQPWLDSQPAPLKSYLTGVLKRLCPDDPLAFNLYQELRCPAESQPELKIMYAACCGDGLLYVLKAQDPRGLLGSARWVCGGKEIDVPLDRQVWHSTLGDIHVGFVHGFDLADTLENSFELWGVLNSRRAFRVVSFQPENFSGQIPQIFEQIESQSVDGMLGQAVAAAVRDRPAPAATVDWFGARRNECETALVLFVDQMLDYPRAFLTLLAREPSFERSTTFLVGSDPARRPALRRLAEDLNAVTSCSIAVVCLEAQALPSEGLRASLTQVKAATTMIFHRTCLPKGRGWLAGWAKNVSAHDKALATSILLENRSQKSSLCGGCRIVNRHGLELLKNVPLRSSSIEADLTGLDEITINADPDTLSAICYDHAPLVSAMQSRADALAVAFSETVAL